MKNAAFSLLQTVAAVSLVFAIAAGAEAQRRSERDVRDAVRSLNSKLDDVDAELRYQLDSNSGDRGQMDDLADDIRELRDRIKLFQENFERHRENRDDVNAIIDGARPIDAFMNSYPQNRRDEDDWRDVRAQIDRLASNYGVTA